MMVEIDSGLNCYTYTTKPKLQCNLLHDINIKTPPAGMNPFGREGLG